VLLQFAVMPLLFVFAHPLVAIFNSNPDVVRYGSQYLRVLAPMLLVLGFSTAWESAQRGAGATRGPMMAALISNWGVKIPAALVFAGLLGFGVTGIWLGIGASIVVEAGILAIGYYRARWLHKEVHWEKMANVE
jgi:Na+-driven multidrug efflux pump